MALWPDSPHWTEAYKAGQNGTVMGRGVVMSGGSYLGKLRKMGLVQRDFDRGNTWLLTQAGRVALTT